MFKTKKTLKNILMEFSFFQISNTAYKLNLFFCKLSLILHLRQILVQNTDVGISGFSIFTQIFINCFSFCFSEMYTQLLKIQLNFHRVYYY